MGRPTKMPAPDVVKADHDAGMTNEQMGEKYGVSRSVVSSFLSKHGFRRMERRFVPEVADIAACVQKGMTLKDMAAALGGDPDAISRVIVKHGLRGERSAGVAVRSVHLPRPGPTKVINKLGISIPRIPTIHGHFGAQL